MIIKSRPVMLLLALLSLTLPVHAAEPISIRDAWIADAPPVARIRAGYLKLQNTSAHNITIQSFSSPDFDRIELHRTIVADGMVSMEEIKELTVKAGEKIEFKPGGYHLMCFNPKRRLKNADRLRIRLELKDKTTTTFTAIVRKRGEEMESGHEHHHHH